MIFYALNMSLQFATYSPQHSIFRASRAANVATHCSVTIQRPASLAATGNGHFWCHSRSSLRERILLVHIAQVGMVRSYVLQYLVLHKDCQCVRDCLSLITLSVLPQETHFDLWSPNLYVAMCPLLAANLRLRNLRRSFRKCVVDRSIMTVSEFLERTFDIIDTY
jgi:hypothetical protein